MINLTSKMTYLHYSHEVVVICWKNVLAIMTRWRHLIVTLLDLLMVSWYHQDQPRGKLVHTELKQTPFIFLYYTAYWSVLPALVEWPVYSNHCIIQVKLSPEINFAWLDFLQTPTSTIVALMGSPIIMDPSTANSMKVSIRQSFNWNRMYPIV